MHRYAQTNIQLFNQLRRDRYSPADLTRIRDAYELAMHLFTGRFQASGKPFLAHVVGTASILHSLHLPAEIVSAGLIHSVYQNGEFGDARSGVTNSRREQVRRAVGLEVEKYAARFSTLPWGPKILAAIPAMLERCDDLDRHVIVIHLADHLEHQLDLEVLYHPQDARRAYMTPYRESMLKIADALGLPCLAAELKQAYEENDAAEVPQELRSRSEVTLIAPKSCRPRWTAVGLKLIRSSPALRFAASARAKIRGTANRLGNRIHQS
jgi:(p)ppGpp synthase/HD superfamily hydrolase